MENIKTITTINNNNNIKLQKIIPEEEEEENISDKWKQYLLPKAPIPNLKNTLIRYLEYSSVLAQTYNLDLNKTIKYVKEFEENYGQKLQEKLKEIYNKEDNWINKFWLKEMYLSQRLALPINFNPAYIFPHCNFKNEKEQIIYASLLIKGFLDFKDKIEKKQIPLETVPDRFINSQSIPMCMDQYERVLNFYREPAINEDILIDRRINKKQQNNNNNNLEHILILYKNQTFLLFINSIEGILLNYIQIFEQLNKIIKMAKNRNIKNIIPLGGSGTGERNKSAKFWEEMKKEKINQNSLEMIRSSIFVLCLDDDNNEIINNNYINLNKLEKDGIQILNGFGPYNNGLNRWFDSTIQLIISKNGCCGVCIEHSIAEGIVHIKMTEEAMRYANYNFNLFKQKKEEEYFNFNNNNLSIIEPKPLSWIISEKAKLLLEEQIDQFESLTNNLQLNLLQFKEFGKISIKNWKVSPDGFMQLCMQLAHFKLHGYLVNSYESATMRRFRLGRVDNIRAATPEVLNWVKSMNNPNEDKKIKKILLKLALDKQVLITKENLNGNGIDNHLCALQILCREEFGLENIPKIFKDQMWKEMMRFPLSTSQVTTSPEFNDCYLYYGPVVNDGYGCAYNIQPNSLIFAISTWISNKRTNGYSFYLKLIESLKEMRELFEN